MILVGLAAAGLAVAAGPIVAAVACAGGGVGAALFGVAALVDRVHGGWWVFVGVLALLGGGAAFVLLR